MGKKCARNLNFNMILNVFNEFYRTNLKLNCLQKENCICRFLDIRKKLTYEEY